VELKDLVSFVVLAEELHFGRAAARLHISPPPLTQRIKRLENEFGAMLFERDNRNVALTPAGLALLEEARIVLDRTQHIHQRLQGIALGESGPLRIGLTGSIVYSNTRGMLAGAIAPGIHATWVVLSSTEQVKALREHRLDLGLINTPIDHEGVEVRALEKEPLVAALASTHRLARRKSIDLALLRNETFIVGNRRQSPNYYDRLISACQRAGFVPKVQEQSQSLLAYMGLIALGAGVTITPQSLARAGLAGISYLPIEGRAPLTEVSLAWPADSTSSVARRVLAQIKLPSRPAIRRSS
jgi:DNA-binding transcriptional LysR family regulator